MIGESDWLLISISKYYFGQFLVFGYLTKFVFINIPILVKLNCVYFICQDSNRQSIFVRSVVVCWKESCKDYWFWFIYFITNWYCTFQNTESKISQR